MWQQYWIYIKGQEDKDYFELLDEVVSPMLDFIEIDKFFFFRYLHDGMHYIRLRVEGTEKGHATIKYDLDRFQSADMIIKHEDSDYNAVEDIAGRFGQTRYKDIIDMCELASKIALNFACGKEVYDPHPQQVGGVAGIVHLIGNTLNYVVELEPSKKYNVKDWDRTQKRENNVP
jgi:hypothetical protein